MSRGSAAFADLFESTVDALEERGIRATVRLTRGRFGIRRGTQTAGLHLGTDQVRQPRLFKGQRGAAKGQPVA